MSSKFFLLPTAALLAWGLGATGRAQVVSAPPASVAVEASLTSRSADRTIYLRALPSPDELSRDAAARRETVLRIEQTPRNILIRYRTRNGSVVTDAYELMPGSAAAAMSTVPLMPTAAEVPSAPVVPDAPTVTSPSPMAAPVTTVPTYAATVAAPPIVVVPASPAPSVVYYDYAAPYSYPSDYAYAYPAYYPGYYYGYGYRSFYSPVSVHVGLGFHSGGHRGGGYHVGGGYRSHR